VIRLVSASLPPSDLITRWWCCRSSVVPQATQNESFIANRYKTRGILPRASRKAHKNKGFLEPETFKGSPKLIGHRSISNTVVYTAVADKRIRNIWGKR
jgi:hypothetical protein